MDYVVDKYSTMATNGGKTIVKHEECFGNGKVWWRQQKMAWNDGNTGRDWWQQKRKSFKWQRLVALTKMILQMAANDGNTTVRCSSTACVGGDRDPDHRITRREKLLRNTSFNITIILSTYMAVFTMNNLEMISIIPITLLQSERSFYTRLHSASHSS